MKSADPRIPPDTQLRLSDWDADDTDIIGKPKSDVRARLDRRRRVQAPLSPDQRFRTHAGGNRHHHSQVLSAYFQGRAEKTPGSAPQQPGKAMEIPPGRSCRACAVGRYMEACDAAMSAISTAHAPWHVIPANSKLARNLMISRLLIEALVALKKRYPVPEEGISGTMIA